MSMARLDLSRSMLIPCSGAGARMDRSRTEPYSPDRTFCKSIRHGGIIARRLTSYSGLLASFWMLDCTRGNEAGMINWDDHAGTRRPCRCRDVESDARRRRQMPWDFPAADPSPTRAKAQNRRLPAEVVPPHGRQRRFQQEVQRLAFQPHLVTSALSVLRHVACLASECPLKTSWRCASSLYCLCSHVIRSPWLGTPSHSWRVNSRVLRVLPGRSRRPPKL